MTKLADLIRVDVPLRTAATSVYAYKKAIEAKYVFTSRFGDDVKLHRVSDDGKEIHLPRGLCPIGKLDERIWGDDVDYPLMPQPRPNQVAIFKTVRKALLAGQSGVVVAYTGWGKTALGYYAAAITGKKTLVITTKDDIYKQWLNGTGGHNAEFNFLGLPWEDVGQVRGNLCEVKDTKFVVAMIHSLSKTAKYPAWITEGFGLVIFDECHRLPADQFQAVVDMFPAALRLGLSATPQRSDGKELLVFAHIGNIIAQTESEELVPKVLRFKSEWKCPRVPRTDPETKKTIMVPIPHEAGKTTHIEKIIAADEERNHMIGQLIADVHEKGRKLVVFSTLHEHLRTLHRVCNTHHKISGKEMGFYLGATTKAEKLSREKAKVKSIIFTTFGMMGEGTNIPWLDTGLMAMPRSKVTQPVGRIRREYEGKKPPVWIDVMDQDSPVFLNYASSREKWYGNIGAVVVDMF